MPVINRRRVALFLIVLGLLLLGLGAWILFGLLRPEPKVTVDPGNRDLQAVNRDTPQAPRTISLPTTVTGTSTAEQVSQMKVSPYREAIRRAESVVSRMGSGTSQDGFLGLSDVAGDGTARFQNYLSTLRNDLQTQHPASGALYGMTTRVVSSAVTQGDENSDVLVLSIKSQKAEDQGDRSKTTAVVYEESTITMQKQSDGFYLVDEVVTKAVED